MKVNKYITQMAAGLFIAGFLWAVPADAQDARQNRHDRSQFMEQRLQRMSEALELTQEQQTQLREVFSQQVAERRGQRNRARFQAIQEAIAGILTPEQQAKMQEMRPERPGRPARVGNPRLRVNRIGEQLNLTPDQQEAIRNILSRQMQERRAAIEGVLTPEQQAKLAEIRTQQRQRGDRGQQYRQRRTPQN